MNLLIDGSRQDINDGSRKKSKQDEFLIMLQKSDEREHEMKTAKMNLETRRLDLQERDLELRERAIKMQEASENHKRVMDQRKLDLEEKRVETERLKTEADVKEKNTLVEILLKKLN